MIKNSRFFARFNKLTSQTCNTQMSRKKCQERNDKEMSLSLTIISCVAATTHKFVNNMRQMEI